MNLLRIILLIVGLMALVNCTEKGKPIVNHDVDQRQPERPTATQGDARDVPVPVNSELKTLAAKVLNENRVRDLRSHDNRQVHDELLALNEQLLKSPDVALLREYIRLLELECGSIKASCIGLRFFRTVGSSASVVKMVAQMPDFQDKAGRLVLFALELKNGIQDPELLRLLIIKVSPANASAKSLLETSLMMISQTETDPQRLRKFLDAVGGWDLVNNKRWPLGTSAQQAVWSMIARAKYFYTNTGELNPQFKEMANALSNEPTSLLAVQNRVIKNNLLVPQALGATPLKEWDELYFLADAVFTKKIDSAVAVELFRSSRRKPAELAATIENYVRLRFSLGLADANVAAKSIFFAAVPTEKLLIHALVQSPIVKSVWGSLSVHLEFVKTFALASLKETAEGSTFEPPLRAQFNSFARTVNLASVYPHTLLLFYLLSQKRFQLTIPGIGDVDTGTLMPRIYHGTIPPLLKYSDDRQILGHFGIVHAFDFGVRSRLFKAMGVEVDDFISDVLSRLTQKQTSFIEKTLSSIDQRYRQSPHFVPMKEVCSELKTGQSLTREIGIDDIISSPYLGELTIPFFNNITSGGSQGGANPGELRSSTAGLYYLDGEFAELIEQARLDLAQYQRTGLAMVESYSSYLIKYEGLSTEEVARRTKKSLQRLKTIQLLRDRVRQSAVTLWNQMGWCYTKVALRDIEMINEVTRREEENLRAIHRDMVRLRAGVSAEERQRILSSHSFTGLPSDFKGYDKIDENSYVMSSIDLIIRSGLSAQKISPNIHFNLGSRLDLDVDAVRNATYRSIPFHENEQIFVESGLRAIFSSEGRFVNWHYLIGQHLTMWGNLVKALMASYRFESEKGNVPTTFTPQLILSVHEELLKLTELSEYDRHIFNILHQDRRYDPMVLSDRIMVFDYDPKSARYTVQGYWALFDFPVLLASEEMLGYNYDLKADKEPKNKEYFPKRYSHSALGRLYYTSRSYWTRGNPMVAYNPNVDRLLDSIVGQTVRDGFMATQVFHEATQQYLNEIQSRASTLKPRADVNMFKSIYEPLSDHLFQSFKANQAQFHQSTQSCFVSKCADFK